MIKAIIFDVGEVIHYIRFNDFYKEFLGINEKAISEEKEFGERKFRKQMDAGDISLEEYFEKVKERYGLSCNLKEYVQKFRGYSEWSQEMIKFIDKLKEDYPLFILSDNSELFMDNKIKDYLSQFFEKQFYSWEIGSRKPEKEIYEYVLNNINYKPEECIFTDDKEENLIAARNFGINTIHFKNLEQFKEKLSELNVI